MWKEVHVSRYCICRNNCYFFVEDGSIAVFFVVYMNTNMCCLTDFNSQLLIECIVIEMSSESKEVLSHDYNFIVVGGGIAGVTCLETVSSSVASLFCCLFTT